MPPLHITYLQWQNIIINICGHVITNEELAFFRTIIYC
jgi:hypothetical protein